MTEDEAKARGMQASDIPALRGDPEFNRVVVRDAFSDEILTRIEKEDPGRTEHYMEVVDFIMSAVFAMTQPEGTGGVAMEFGEDALPLEPEELQVLLIGMERYELITREEKGGIRITQKALKMIQPYPKEQAD